MNNSQAKGTRYRRIKKVYSSLLFPRPSSEVRLTGGVAFSSNSYVAWAATNFGYMVAYIHDFPGAEKWKLVGKYGFSAFALSLSYLSPVYSGLNEVTFGLMKRRYDYENFYVSHSVTALICIPGFAALQCKVYVDFLTGRKSFLQARLLAYRYVGTMCCFSLIAEAVLHCSRYIYLSATRTDVHSSKPLEQIKELMQARLPRSRDVGPPQSGH